MRLPEGVGIVFDVATGALDGRRRRLGDSVWPLGDGRRGSCANSTFRIRRTRSRQRRSVGRPAGLGLAFSRTVQVVNFGQMVVDNVERVLYRRRRPDQRR